MSTEFQVALIGGLSTVVVGLLTYLGVTRQTRAARSASDRASRQQERDSALAAWEKLLEPYITEVDRLRRQQDKDREASERREREIAVEQKSQRTMIEDLTDQVQTWQRVAKTIARWATSLRDEVLRLGGTVPATPEELLTLQAIDPHDGDDQT